MAIYQCHTYVGPIADCRWATDIQLEAWVTFPIEIFIQILDLHCNIAFEIKC